VAGINGLISSTNSVLNLSQQSQGLLPPGTQFDVFRGVAGEMRLYPPHSPSPCHSPPLPHHYPPSFFLFLAFSAADPDIFTAAAYTFSSCQLRVPTLKICPAPKLLKSFASAPKPSPPAPFSPLMASSLCQVAQMGSLRC
jgi:hypothetical protein